jgi:hypothetical protein
LQLVDVVQDFSAIMLIWMILILKSKYSMLLMTEQFVVVHWYSVLQETEESWRIINRPMLKHVTICGNIRTSIFFCGLPNSLIMWEPHIDKLCGLRQIAVSWAMYPLNRARFFQSLFWEFWLILFRVVWTNIVVSSVTYCSPAFLCSQ